jgi:hypothetical protein
MITLQRQKKITTELGRWDRERKNFEVLKTSLMELAKALSIELLEKAIDQSLTILVKNRA